MCSRAIKILASFRHHPRSRSPRECCDHVIYKQEYNRWRVSSHFECYASIEAGVYLLIYFWFGSSCLEDSSLINDDALKKGCLGILV
jgi:hypothetical protein